MFHVFIHAESRLLYTFSYVCTHTHTHILEESRREIVRRNGAKERRGEQERVMGEHKQSRHYVKMS